MTDIKKVVPHGQTFSGRYFPKNLWKYIGDPQKIIYRSGWEKKFCIWCDDNTDVIKWASEPFPIKYLSPLDNKVHEYFVDFYVKIEVGGKEKEFIVEVKPKKQTVKPVEPKRKTAEAMKGYIQAMNTYIINYKKFAAARQFAAQRGFTFFVATEDFIDNLHSSWKS